MIASGYCPRGWCPVWRSSSSVACETDAVPQTASTRPPLAAPRPKSLEPQELGFPARAGAVARPRAAGRHRRPGGAGRAVRRLPRQARAAEPVPDARSTTTADDDEFWLDYVADLGDGFNATYSVAYLLAQPELDVDGERLPRGQALVMGGDQVYPTASGQAYEDRFQGPYRAALPERPAGPAGADAVRAARQPRLVRRPDRVPAALRPARGHGTSAAGAPQQTRCYFALQAAAAAGGCSRSTRRSGAYLDDPQLEYFREVAPRCCGRATG